MEKSYQGRGNNIIFAPTGSVVIPHASGIQFEYEFTSAITPVQHFPNSISDDNMLVKQLEPAVPDGILTHNYVCTYASAIEFNDKICKGDGPHILC